MSSRSRSRSIDPDAVKPLDEYTGRNRYVDWIEDYLGVILTEVQKQIIYTIMDNQRTVVVAGNGIGKTYTLACFSLAYLFVNYPTSVLATSGTYQKLRRTYCRPVENLHQNATVPLPGEYLKSSPPRIVIRDDPEVYWEAASASDAGELEGVHNEYTLAIVEEADKGSVTEKTFDALGSLLTDANDKIVAVANPPRGETNVIYDKMNDPNWAVTQPSSFDSHNVKLEKTHPNPYVRDEDGEIVYEDETGDPKIRETVRKQMIPEMVTLSQIRQDWEAWNNTEWPGAVEAMNSGSRNDLDERWYRRRLGQIPPTQSEELRPFTPQQVEEAWERNAENVSKYPNGMGWDVARGANEDADYNALAAVFRNKLDVLDYWRVGDHVRNEQKVRELVDEDRWSCPLLIDSVGSGSEAADRVKLWYPNTERYNSAATAAQEADYANRWTEGLITLGEFLRDGGSITSSRLREELLAAGRAITLEERYHAATDTTRYKATSKAAIKEVLGRSPDLLDAALMAVTVAEQGRAGRTTVPGRF
jgi:hypothetical protein